MKKLYKLIGTQSRWLCAIALAAAIGFSFTACDELEPLSRTPAAPTGLEAAMYSTSQILLSWNAVPGASGYKVYASLNSGSGYILLGQTQGIIATHSGVPTDRAIYYKVTAFNSYGESGYSNIANATISTGGNPNPNDNLNPNDNPNLNPGGGGTAPTITTSSLPGGTVGTSYYQTLSASGDTPIVWGLESGTLPTGLNLLANGTISGTPTTAGTSNFTVRAFNTAGSVTKALSIAIVSSGNPNPDPGGNETLIPLTAGVWEDGTVSASDSSVWYSFTAISGTTYYLWWNDKDQGNGSKTADVRVSAYEPNGTAIFTTVDSGWTSPRTILVNTTGTVKIKVVPYSAAGIGTFAVVYNTTSTRPSVGNGVDGRTFTSISAFSAALADSPPNTRATAYNVNINVSDLGGAYNASGSLGYVLRATANANKYVNIDLSGGSITAIQQNALRANSTLAGVTIGGNVASIGANAFYQCTGLTSVTMGSSVTAIASDAFSGCTNLTSLTIGSGVTTIGLNAFAYCDSLPSVTIPNSVTSIGQAAFYGCTTLASVTIGSSVTSIGTEAFRGCNILNNVTIPNSVKSIGDGAFRNCLILNNVTLGSGVESIGGNAFDGCANLTSIIIPNSVTGIGTYAFANCTNLATVTLGTGVSTIGNYAFQNCTNLATVIFQSSGVSIGSAGVFRGDLRAKYLATNGGGAGTYTRAGEIWTKS